MPFVLNTLLDASTRFTVEVEDRIDRMERSGVITAGQAERLRASVRRTATRSPNQPATRRAGTYLATAIVLLLLVMLIAILSMPDGTPPVQDVSRALNEPGVQGTMNKTILNLIAIALFVLIPVVLLTWVYNGLVNREEAVFKGWAQVESQLQRRADLVPGLVEVVSRYLRHERETLNQVTATRSAALSQTIDDLTQSQQEASRLLEDDSLLRDQARMDELARLQQEVGKQMHGFLALAEDYPELRASDQFLELQAQLEGTENRINVARLQFNEAVENFNAAIRRLPGTLVAGLGDFRRKAYFQADASAAEVPELEFD